MDNKQHRASPKPDITESGFAANFHAGGGSRAAGRPGPRPNDGDKLLIQNNKLPETGVIFRPATAPGKFPRVLRTRENHIIAVAAGFAAMR